MLRERRKFQARFYTSDAQQLDVPEGGREKGRKGETGDREKKGGWERCSVENTPWKM